MTDSATSSVVEAVEGALLGPRGDDGCGNKREHSYDRANGGCTERCNDAERQCTPRAREPMGPSFFRSPPGRDMTHITHSNLESRSARLAREVERSVYW